jgi:aminoglycoside phosphotransferase (APT) family kinase protein
LQPSEVQRAVAAAMSTGSALGLTVDDVVVLQNSNKLAVRLLPCDVFARVAPLAQQVALFEVELAQRLAEVEAPVAALEPRVEPRPYERDGFVITLWTYYASVTASDVAPADYANALARLHSAMRKFDVTAPHFTARVAEAEQLVASRDQTPALADEDRQLLSDTFRSLRRTIAGRGAAEQLLHGEPHPGNLLSTKNGPLFIDLETCCRGPIEFDLAHVPEAVIAHYPGVDQQLLDDCRRLVLAMLAAWRWDARDQFPNGRQWAQDFVGALRKGPPWPSLDAMTRRLAGP